jgi:hypothetical protein
MTGERSPALELSCQQRQPLAGTPLELISWVSEVSPLREAGMRNSGWRLLAFFHALTDRDIYAGFVVAATSAALLCGTTTAWSGPCTAPIAQLERQINLAASDPAADPDAGPTAPQTVGAQLHHQPTPGKVEHAERVANADADAALDRARKADAAGDADGCNRALEEARRLYGID